MIININFCIHPQNSEDYCIVFVEFIKIDQHRVLLDLVSPSSYPCIGYFSTQRMLVRWVPPSEGAIKLNVDGSSRGNPGRSGCGGLLRDQDGNCIAGFVSHIGFANSVVAELMGIRHGLWLAWKSGYRKVECESDCMVALQIIHSHAKDFPEFARIVEEIHEFMLLEWDVTIYHVMREANSCADFLAKIGSSSNCEFAVLMRPPPELTRLLLADSEGVLYSRAN